ncbi:MAG: hypothetical protein V1810_02370 [Candidatus Beckwithbacteria bacterium]
MKIKQHLGFLLIAVLLVSATLIIGFSKMVKAADTGTVAATVTAIIYSVSLDNGDGIAFSTVGVGSSANTTAGAGGVNDSTTATNNGSVSEKLSVKSSNSTGGAGWTMAAAAGSEIYTMKSCITDCDGAAPAWNAFGANASTYADLAASVGVGLTQPFDLQIYTPTATTVTAQQSLTVTVMAGAL